MIMVIVFDAIDEAVDCEIELVANPTTKSGAYVFIPFIIKSGYDKIGPRIETDIFGELCAARGFIIPKENE